jgi:hypothetical protein
VLYLKLKKKQHVLDFTNLAKAVFRAVQPASTFGARITHNDLTELIFIIEKSAELKTKLGILEGYDHICAIALGYKDEEPPAKSRRKDVVNYII